MWSSCLSLMLRLIQLSWSVPLSLILVLENKFWDRTGESISNNTSKCDKKYSASTNTNHCIDCKTTCTPSLRPNHRSYTLVSNNFHKQCDGQSILKDEYELIKCCQMSFWSKSFSHIQKWSKNIGRTRNYIYISDPTIIRCCECCRVRTTITRTRWPRTFRVVFEYRCPQTVTKRYTLF